MVRIKPSVNNILVKKVKKISPFGGTWTHIPRLSHIQTSGIVLQAKKIAPKNDHR